jgi:hypothetical protein
MFCKPDAPSLFAPVNIIPMSASLYDIAADSNNTSMEGRLCDTNSSLERGILAYFEILFIKIN